MINTLKTLIKRTMPAETVSAHCDGPCGVYDPASARIAAEAALSMTKKILALNAGAHDHATNNTLSRYIAIKEEQTHIAKTELLVLWTDYFKPVHLEAYPDLHDTFWNAAKLCSAVKVEVSLEKAEALMAAIEKSIKFSGQPRIVKQAITQLHNFDPKWKGNPPSWRKDHTSLRLFFKFMALEIAEMNVREFFLWLTFRRKLFRVQGNSMLPSLNPGDLVLADLKAYFQRSPTVGDLVVARHPDEVNFKIIKRVESIDLDGNVRLVGENPSESTNFEAIKPENILGRVTCKFL